MCVNLVEEAESLVSSALALLRFILTSHGSITIDGRKLSDTNLDAIRSRITLVPQVSLRCLFLCESECS